jgi:hypothetical protein
MPAIRYFSDIVQPWDELNGLLAKRLALQPDPSDVTRLAGSLAVAIRHQVEILGIKDSQANAECFDHRVISGTADFWKHGSLRKQERNNCFSAESFFKYESEKGFSFLRNALFVEHVSLGKHDFLQASLAAIYYWINKRGFNVVWQGTVRENPTEFFEEAFLNFESEKCIALSQVRLSFFSRQQNGLLESVDPPEARFAVYERL